MNTQLQRRKPNRTILNLLRCWSLVIVHQVPVQSCIRSLSRTCAKDAHPKLKSNPILPQFRHNPVRTLVEKGHLLLSRCRSLKNHKNASKSDRAICLMLFRAIALLVEYVGCCNSLCELFGSMCQLIFRFLSRLQFFNKKNNSYSSDRHSNFAVQSPLSWQQ